MPVFETFRPRAGATYTINAGAVQSVAIPLGTNTIQVVCTLAPGRVGVGTATAAPALSDSAYGYIGANIPMTLKITGDTRLYLGSGIASNVFYITFGN